jgi:hypothetical protein
MAITYEKIQSTTLGTATATITFSTIPATYTDLRVVLVWTASSTNTPRMRFNGDTGTNYSTTMLFGDGSSAQSARWTSQATIQLCDSGTTSTPFMATADVFSYAGSTNKTVLHTGAQDNNGSGQVTSGVSLWRDTSAINTVALFPASGTFSTGTTATLYGILKA